MNKDQIMEAIENMTVLELSELVKAMEEKFGVSAAAPAVAVAAAGAAPAEGAAAAEQTEFDVVLKEAGDQKLQGHQGGTRGDWPGPEGSQRPGRQCSENHQRGPV